MDIKRTRLLASAAAALALVLAGTSAGPAEAKPKPRPTTVVGHLIAINDFHGAIDPPTGSGAAVNGTPAGGVEYLATAVKALRAQQMQESPYSLTVAAGDLVGGTPLVSAAFHDEPVVEEMNKLGLDVTSVGNHEFDRAWPSCAASRTAAATRSTDARTATASPVRSTRCSLPTWSTGPVASRSCGPTRSGGSAASRSASSA